SRDARERRCPASSRRSKQRPDGPLLFLGGCAPQVPPARPPLPRAASLRRRGARPAAASASMRGSGSPRRTLLRFSLSTHGKCPHLPCDAVPTLAVLAGAVAAGAVAAGAVTAGASRSIRATIERGIEIFPHPWSIVTRSFSSVAIPVTLRPLVRKIVSASAT